MANITVNSFELGVRSWELRITDHGPRVTGSKGFTLLEMILVIALLSLFVVALTPFLRTTVQSWEIKDREIEVLQNGRAGMDKMTRELKTAVVVTTALNNRVVVTDGDGNSVEYRLSGTELQRNTYSLAEPISALTFTYYDSAGSVTAVAGNVRLIDISMTVSDSEGKVNPVTFNSRVTLYKDFLASGYALAINEINYNPPGTGTTENRREWVEVYNYGTSSINMANLRFVDSSATDTIQAYGGSGSTTIPAGGYGIITANPTTVYSYYTVSPSAVRLQVDDSIIGNGLSDSSETITVRDSSGVKGDTVTYSDSWGGDGNGQTIERRNPRKQSSTSTNWERSGETGTYTAGSANTV